VYALCAYGQLAAIDAHAGAFEWISGTGGSGTGNVNTPAQDAEYLYISGYQGIYSLRKR
jgi:hypothetical protein